MREYVEDLRGSGATTIHVLYISHFDSDHVNGLEYLSELTRPDIRILRICVPFLTPAQKLALVVSQRGSILRSYVDMVLDPARTLGRLFEGAEIEILFPDGDDLAPFDEPVPADTLGSAEGGTRITASRGRVAMSEFPGDPPGSSPHLLWELVPFVQPAVDDLAQEFWECAKHDRKNMPALSEAASPSSNDIDLMVGIYRRKARNLAIKVLGRDGSNISSIVLFSGAAATLSKGVARLWVCSKGRRWRRDESGGTAAGGFGAWLSTGDARLAHAGSITPLRQRLGALRAERVSVVAAPHHGSKENSSWRLWSAFPSAKHISIHANDTKHHPHKDVTNEILRGGLFAVVVKTADDDLTLQYSGYF